MKSFLERTFVVGNFVGEHGYGAVKYKTVEGEERKAKFLFLTGREVEVGGPEELTGDARKEDKRKLDEAKKKNEAPPAPEVSARAKLVEVALGPDGRDFFPRSIVNRTWHRLFGQGLGDAARPDALGEPPEPSRAARLAGVRPGRARL